MSKVIMLVDTSTVEVEVHGRKYKIYSDKSLSRVFVKMPRKGDSGWADVNGCKTHFIFFDSRYSPEANEDIRKLPRWLSLEKFKEVMKDLARARSAQYKPRLGYRRREYAERF